ncbi:MAG TPA: hypothetical protein VFY54_01375, partial [Rubrobacter sp.]|nr:hypothetical protein [Rubrobacter sp.]
GTELDSYFDAMESIATNTDDELEAITEEANNATFSSDEQEIVAIKETFIRTVEVLESAVQEVSQLEPPSEVEAAHSSFLSTLEDFAAVAGTLSRDFSQVTTRAEAEAVLEQHERELAAADDAFDEACATLQMVADENNIDRDLRCGDD